MLDLMPIRDEIKTARKQAGLTQEDLALKCQELGNPIQQKDISNFESGNANPSLEKIEVIARALGMNWKLEKGAKKKC